MTRSDLSKHPRYDDFKDEAFGMTLMSLRKEISRLEDHEPTSFGGAEEAEVQLAAYEDALSERATQVDERVYPEAATHDTPSLRDSHGYGPIFPK